MTKSEAILSNRYKNSEKIQLPVKPFLPPAKEILILFHHNIMPACFLAGHGGGHHPCIRVQNQFARLSGSLDYPLQERHRFDCAVRKFLVLNS